MVSWNASLFLDAFVEGHTSPAIEMCNLCAYDLVRFRLERYVEKIVEVPQAGSGGEAFTQSLTGPFPASNKPHMSMTHSEEPMFGWGSF